MEKLINITRHDRRNFPKHFLASVHSEIGFSPVDSSLLKNSKEKLSGSLKSLGFTDLDYIFQSEISLKTEIDKPAVLSQPREPDVIGIKIVNQSEKYELHFENNKLVLSSFKYKGFESFSKLFEECFEIIGTTLNIETKINKISLRKINSVVMQPITSFQEALSVFNPALFAIPRSGIVKLEHFKINESITVLEESLNNLIVLKSKLTKPQDDTLEALLDIDLVSREQFHPLSQVFTKVLPDLNQYHFDVFMWSVRDNLREIMESK